MGGHPGDGVLLGLLDGELPEAEARVVREHLETCAACRAEAAGIERASAAYALYRTQALDPRLPPPPAPWMEIRREFDRIDEQAAGHAWSFVWWRWAAAAVATALAIGIFLHLRETPSVKAATLLRKAVAAAEARPRPVGRRVVIRTRTARIMRVSGAAAPGQPDPPAEVRALFEAARYDWRDPLSARSFQAWREGLQGRAEDEVFSTPEAVRIRTAPEAGEVASASLTLRAADYEPVEGRLEFRNREWVEMSEIPEPSTGSADAPASNPVEVPLRPVEPSRPAAAVPGAQASMRDELQVLSALHRIGADLGDPVEVKAAEGRVLVAGTGVPEARQRAIREALSGMPGVEVRFSEPAAPPSAAGPPDAGTSRPAPVAGVRARIEHQLGGRVEFERFGAQLLDWNEAAMARAYALGALAGRFPAAAEASLGTDGAGTLRAMAGEHAAAMEAHAASIRAALQPALAALGAVAAPPRQNAAGDWQTAAAGVLASARRVELLVSVLAGAAADRAAGAELPGELLTALAQWEADIHALRRLIAE
jgi:hypothetical protein